MITIGIDPSLTNTGIVVLSDHPYGDLQDNWIIQPKTAGVLRLFEIRGELIKLLDRMAGEGESPADLVVIEGYAFARPNQAHQIGELGGMIRMLMTARGENWIEVAPSALKKFATGKGNAPKELILQQVYKRWGVEFDDNNLADAFTLAKVGQAYLLPECAGLTAFQAEVLAALRGGKVKKSRKAKAV